MTRQRNWCFTLNNPEEKELIDENDFDLETWKHPYATYIVCQLEQGEKGTPHLQGYVQLSKALRLPQLKQWLPAAHFEPARGSPTDNKTYCTKQEGRLAGPWEWGEIRRQGQRTDLAELVEAVKQGMELLDIILKWPHALKYIKHLQYLKSLFAPKRRAIPCIVWLWGESGTGKSTAANLLAPNAYQYCQGSTGNWWNGYDGQRTVIFNEFDGKYPIKRLQQVLDVHPYRVEVKGSSAALSASNFIFTSNEAPATTYTGSDDVDPLLRRLENWAIVGEFFLSKRDDGSSVTMVRWTEPGGGGWRTRTEEKEGGVKEFFSYLCAYWDLYQNQ